MNAHPLRAWLSALLRRRPRLVATATFGFLVTLALTATGLVAFAPAAQTVPIIEIETVDPTGGTVTIKARAFPADQTFTITMGAFGSRGVDGVLAGSVDSGVGGEFTATVAVPKEVQDLSPIAIRLESPQGYYSYNYFFWPVAAADPSDDRDTAGPAETPTETATPAETPTETATPAPPPAAPAVDSPTVSPAEPAEPAPPPGGVPSFVISAVAGGESVTVSTRNFPAGQTFTVHMGPYGGRGLGGVQAGTVDSGAGGAFSATFAIPASLRDMRRIAIRLDSPGGYFSYNWFYNRTATVDTAAEPVEPAPASPPAAAPTTAAPTATPAPATPPATPPPAPAAPTTAAPAAEPVYRGFPTFAVTAVTRDDTVTIHARNLPPGQRFFVTMDRFGTRGLNGFLVGQIESGDGGELTLTFPIAAALKGRERIALRLQSQAGYFAYNWFYNR